jgi:hypothetical protein
VILDLESATEEEITLRVITHPEIPMKIIVLPNKWIRL